MTRDLTPFVALANRLADAARPICRQYFRTPLTIDDKADASPVTIADRTCESVMRKLINETFPEHGIHGEEFGIERPDADYVWVLDPIDGTKAFITGMPTFGVLIALLHKGEPVVGIIDQPIKGERWLGVAGQPTTLNGQPVRVRACTGLDQAALYTTAPELFIGEDLEPWNRIHDAVKFPRYGADCYAYALLATGCIDLVVECRLQPYDYLALIPVIQGAGGIVTDWQGGKLDATANARVLATGDAAVHAQAVAVLAG